MLMPLIVLFLIQCFPPPEVEIYLKWSSLGIGGWAPLTGGGKGKKKKEKIQLYIPDLPFRW